MTASVKDLRFKISMLFDVLTKGEDITIIYRGKPKAKLISYDAPSNHKKDDAMFGLWKDQTEDVDTLVRNIKKRTQFCSMMYY